MNKKEIWKQVKIDLQAEQLGKERGNVFVCIYNDNTRVSLFERKQVKCSRKEVYKEVDIYTEIDGDLVGMLGRKEGMDTRGLIWQRCLWIQEGQDVLSEEGKVYTSNCQLNKSIYFSDLYRKLTNVPGSIELTPEKIEKVLEYVYTYYDIEKPKEKLKK